MSQIFISYARADVDFAGKLARSLSEMGAEIWIDVNDIPAGMKWSTAIQQGLKVCQVMLLIISPESMASNNVEDEWQYYLDNKKTIIPLLYRTADKHFQISRLQHVDFHATAYNIAFERLLRELQSKGVSIQLPVSTEPAPGTHITDDKGIEMVYVPAGKFLMGSNEQDDEKPIHEVQITKPFWLDLTPVTNAAYARFVKEGGYKTESYWTKSGWDWLKKGKISVPEDYKDFTDPRQPRVGVSWYEGCAYASWRGGRLPTEAEWEWAARGSENRIYPWGDTFDASRLIYEANSRGKTAIVGSGIRSAGASWVGALDMSGNVWEWVNSLFKPYPYGVDDGRENATADGWRVLRGGSWYYDPDDARAAYRLNDDPFYRDFNCGFRVGASPFEPLNPVGTVLRQQQARSASPSLLSLFASGESPFSEIRL